MAELRPIVETCTIIGADVPLPVVPLWDLPAAAVLLGVSVSNLRYMLTVHKGHVLPPLYRVKGRRLHRMLRGSDIKALQVRRLRGPGLADYTRECHG